MSVKFLDRIRGITVDVDPNILWPEGYNPQTYYPLKGKWYRRAVITAEPAKPPYNTEMLPPELVEHNAGRETCPRCHGRGTTRKDKNVGCHVCLGRGSIARQ